MKTIIRYAVLFMSLVTLTGAVAEQVTKEQIKGIDEQVQDIKKDVLGISAQLNQLEEKLLFPSNTQVSVFISLDQASGFEPSAVQLKIDDKGVTHHIYSYTEVEGLLAGGVQRIYTGNVRTGDHQIVIDVVGKLGGGKATYTAKHSFNKAVGPKLVELRLSGSEAELRN